MHSIHEIPGVCLQLVLLKKDAFLIFDRQVHALFWRKTRGSEQVVDRGTLHERKSRKKVIPCFVYTYEGRNSEEGFQPMTTLLQNFLAAGAASGSARPASKSVAIPIAT